MNVYHTSNVQITHPDTRHSRKALDFGSGFYVTPLREQAVTFGKKFSLRGMPAVLNTYDLAPSWREGWRVKTFSRYDGEWIDFIAANRTMGHVETYDAVEGGVANDKIFRTVDLYLAGDISREEALRKLLYESPNYQICFLSEVMMDEVLTFTCSEEL